MSTRHWQAPRPAASEAAQPEWSVEMIYESPTETLCLYDVARSVAETKAAVDRVEAMVRRLLGEGGDG